MSTRRKSGKGLDIHTFLGRTADMRPVKETMMLYLRLYREALAIGEATSEMWTEIAALTNVGILYSVKRQRQDWLDVLGPSASAIISIHKRIDRVGGRWAANKSELEAITTGINLLDSDILSEISLQEFAHFANKLTRIE